VCIMNGVPTEIRVTKTDADGEKEEQIVLRNCRNGGRNNIFDALGGHKGMKVGGDKYYSAWDQKG